MIAARPILACVAACCVLAAPSPAQTPNPSAPATLSLGMQDIYWISATAAVTVPALISYNNMKPVDTNALDKNDLWAVDRWAAGMYSSKASLASDALVVPLCAVPMAVTALESRQGRQSWNAAFADAVVFGEALALSSSIDLWVRSLRVHPRPLVFAESAPASERTAGEASGSFYSGHANAAFLAATYFAYTYGLRHPDSRYQGAIWTGSLGAAALVAGLRVAAGKHYLSDVVTGAAVGSLFGYVLPRLHHKDASGNASAAGVNVGLGYDQSGPQAILTWTF